MLKLPNNIPTNSNTCSTSASHNEELMLNLNDDTQKRLHHNGFESSDFDKQLLNPHSEPQSSCLASGPHEYKNFLIDDPINGLRANEVGITENTEQHADDDDYESILSYMSMGSIVHERERYSITNLKRPRTEQSTDSERSDVKKKRFDDIDLKNTVLEYELLNGDSNSKLETDQPESFFIEPSENKYDNFQETISKTCFENYHVHKFPQNHEMPTKNGRNVESGKEGEIAEHNAFEYCDSDLFNGAHELDGGSSKAYERVPTPFFKKYSKPKLGILAPIISRLGEESEALSDNADNESSAKTSSSADSKFCSLSGDLANEKEVDAFSETSGYVQNFSTGTGFSNAASHINDNQIIVLNPSYHLSSGDYSITGACNPKASWLLNSMFEPNCQNSEKLKHSTAVEETQVQEENVYFDEEPFIKSPFSQSSFEEHGLRALQPRAIKYSQKQAGAATNVHAGTTAAYAQKNDGSLDYIFKSALNNQVMAVYNKYFGVSDDCGKPSLAMKRRMEKKLMAKRAMGHQVNDQELSEMLDCFERFGNLASTSDEYEEESDDDNYSDY